MVVLAFADSTSNESREIVSTAETGIRNRRAGKPAETD